MKNLSCTKQSTGDYITRKNTSETWIIIFPSKVSFLGKKDHFQTFHGDRASCKQILLFIYDLLLHIRLLLPIVQKLLEHERMFCRNSE